MSHCSSRGILWRKSQKGGNVEHCVLVITYERDSIWEIKGAIPVDSSAIEAAPRILNVLGKSYRYQEISPKEVFKLLEEPLGTIAISRPGIVNKSVPGASLSDLKGDFR